MDTNSLYAQAFAGVIPGGQLNMDDRYRLIRELNQLGYSDEWIAKHTQGTLSSITAARVRLGLPAHSTRPETGRDSPGS